MKNWLIVIIFSVGISSCSGKAFPERRNSVVISSTPEINSQTKIYLEETLFIETPTHSTFSMDSSSEISGNLIFTTFSDGALWIMEFPTLVHHQLYSQEGNNINSPLFFPAGEKIVFVLDDVSENRSSDLYQGDIYGTELIKLIDNVSSGNSFDISPDGRIIAFIREEFDSPNLGYDIYLYEVESGNINQITFDGKYKEQIAWSYDGKKIAYIVSNSNGIGDLVVIDKDGSDSTTLLEENVILFSGLSWALREDLIAVPYLQDNNIEIVVVNANTTEKKYIDSLEGKCANPYFISLGNKLISSCIHKESMNVFMFDLTNGVYTQITEYNNSNKIGRTLGRFMLLEGDQIVFSYWEGEPSESVFDLITLNLHGFDYWKLTEELNIDYFDFSYVNNR